MWASGQDRHDGTHWVWQVDPDDGALLHSRRMHSGGDYNSIACAPNELVDLRVRVRIATRTVREETRVTITVTVHNRGNADANDVRILHRLARVFEWLESVADSGEYDLDDGVWRVRVVRAGELMRLVLHVRVRPFTDGHEGNLVVEGEHEDGPAEFQPEDNDDTDEFVVEMDPDGDPDGDGLTNIDEETLGTNRADADSDGDGFNDGDEVGDDVDNALDTDGDGIRNVFDTDDDGDGIPTRDERGDVDGDNVPDHLDANQTDGPLADLDGDNIPNGVEIENGTDPNDRDSDDDGIRDDGELRPPHFFPRDTDGDGIIDALDPDDDNDGEPTRTDRGDRDGDRVPDHLDANEEDGPLGDLDGDNIPNQVEIDNGMDPEDRDSDDDGFRDDGELRPPQFFPRDTDGDGVIDALDDDDDNDGRPTIEGRGDVDGDGILDHLDPNENDGPFGDLDGDGLENGVEREWGTDPEDRDSDDDGVLDRDEPAGHIDTDRDGTPDVLDPDSDDDGVLDGTEIGLTPETVDEDTDQGRGNFLPDMDPRTTTDPRKPDTDGDGRSDGAEDTDGNGRVDPGESDPNHRDRRGDVDPGDDDNARPQNGPVVEEPEVAQPEDEREMRGAPAPEPRHNPAPAVDDEVDTYIPGSEDGQAPVDTNWENPDEAQTPGDGGFNGDVPGCGCSQPGAPARLPFAGALGAALLGLLVLRRRS